MPWAQERRELRDGSGVGERWSKVRPSRCLGQRPSLTLVVLTMALAFHGSWAAAPGISALLTRESVQDLKAGPFYRAGTRVRSPFLGISFVVPNAWRVRLPLGSTVVHMDSAEKPGLGVLLLLETATIEELESKLAQPQAFEEAYVLEPTDDVTREGSRLSASYLHGDTVGRAVAMLGPSSQAIIYLITGPEEEAEYYDRVLTSLEASTRFVEEATARLLHEWYTRLAGMMLAGQPDAASGPFREWHLCSDGTFLYEFRPAHDTPEDSGRAGFRESGTWRVDVTTPDVDLVVMIEHALPRAHDLRFSDDQTFLDGEPFFRQLSNKCL